MYELISSALALPSGYESYVACVSCAMLVALTLIGVNLLIDLTLRIFNFRKEKRR